MYCFLIFISLFVLFPSSSSPSSSHPRAPTQLGERTIPLWALIEPNRAHLSHDGYRPTHDTLCPIASNKVLQVR